MMARSRRVLAVSLAPLVAVCVLACGDLIGIREVVGGSPLVAHDAALDATAMDSAVGVVDGGDGGKPDLDASTCVEARMATTIAKTEIAATVVLDSERVYWSTGIPNRSMILSCPHCGCLAEGPTELATGAAARLALDDTSIYWTDYKGGSVNRFDKLTGKNQDKIAGEKQPNGLAVDEDNVYWTATGDVADSGGVVIVGNGVRRANKRDFRAPVEDMVPQGFSGEINPWAIAVDKEYVYWTTAPQLDGLSVEDATLACKELTRFGAVKRVHKVTKVIQVLSANEICPITLALDDNNVYWTRLGYMSINGEVVTVPKAGGARRVLATGQPTPLNLAVDGDRVFWTTNFASGTIATCKIDDCSPTAVVFGESSPMGLALTRDHIYWPNQGLPTNNYKDSAIRRIMR